MDLVPAPKELLQALAALGLPPWPEARLAQLAAWREQGTLTPDDELFQAWASLRDQFTYLRDNARRLLGEQVN
jgi:hypothetical protein